MEKKTLQILDNYPEETLYQILGEFHDGTSIPEDALIRKLCMDIFGFCNLEKMMIVVLYISKILLRIRRKER